MTTVRNLAASVAAVTDPDSTPPWDPVGLQLGDPDSNVSSIAVCHEVTDRVVEEMESSPVDLLITYHPLLFTPTNTVLKEVGPGARAFRLIRAGVAVLVSHTDFDAAEGGMADSLAGFFDLRNIEAFGDDTEEGLPAIGRVGEFKGTVGSIDAQLSDEFGHVGLRVTGDRDREVRRLAVVPGSGGAFVEVAAELADALVTGDVSHHRCVAASDLGLAVLDPGHIATERPGMASLLRLAANVSGLDPIDLTGIDPQTWA